MIRLKNIIQQLHQDQFELFKSTLKSGHSNNNLVVVEAYRQNLLSDDEIRKKIKASENSYSVIKTRLYDKIQKFLVESESGNDLTQGQSDEINRIIFQSPIEKTNAILEQMETEYIKTDSPKDLINVYSALKKVNFYSDKYYKYSQQYNKQVANLLALEKAEETLFQFNRTLSTYFFTDDSEQFDLLKLLIKEIRSINLLNKSPRIRLIFNIIVIQAELFAEIEHKEESIEDLLLECNSMSEIFEKDPRMNWFIPVMSFLHFEYYNEIGQMKKAIEYYKHVNENFKYWLLHNNYCFAYKYLISKIELMANKKIDVEDFADGILFDNKDIFTKVIVTYYNGALAYLAQNKKLAVTVLNDLLNEISFTNYFYIETEIKFTLTKLYIDLNDLEMAENTLKGVNRKLLGLKTEKFKNVKEAIRLFNLVIGGLDSSSRKQKFSEILNQLEYQNQKGKKVLYAILPDFKKLAI